jgi:hypothetical protein
MQFSTTQGLWLKRSSSPRLRNTYDLSGRPRLLFLESRGIGENQSQILVSLFGIHHSDPG